MNYRCKYCNLVSIALWKWCGESKKNSCKKEEDYLTQLPVVAC